MLDLYISITWMSNADLARTGSSLFANSAFPLLPGWYLRAYKNDGYDDVLKYTLVSGDLVEELAERIDVNIGTKLCPVVQRENNEALVRRREHIARLRKRITEDQQALAKLEGEGA